MIWLAMYMKNNIFLLNVHYAESLERFLSSKRIETRLRLIHRFGENVFFNRFKKTNPQVYMRCIESRQVYWHSYHETVSFRRFAIRDEAVSNTVRNGNDISIPRKIVVIILYSRGDDIFLFRTLSSYGSACATLTTYFCIINYG